MFLKNHSIFQDEQGLSALETAIVLIAFVVVAAVFAFTMLSAGMFSTERSKEAVYAGLEEVRGSMELRGNIVAQAAVTGTTGAKLQDLTFSVSNVAGGEAIDLTDTTGDNKIVIDYLDSSTRVTDLDWTADLTVGNDDGDQLLEDGEMAKLTVTLDPDVSVGTNTKFKLQVKPPKGSVLELERTTPAYFDSVMDLQ